jgi:hypothetical protein
MLDRLARDAAASFVLTDAGRILRENDPDRSSGPRLAMLGCADGNLAFVRHDVPEEVAAAVVREVAQAPPWFEADTLPACAEALAQQLAPVTSVEPSLVFALPRDTSAADERIVRSGTVEGEALLAGLARDGMPAHLVEAGFVGLGDFWAPWCVRLDDGEIAAIAFVSRLGAAAAEVGVYTFALAQPRLRGGRDGGLVGAAGAQGPRAVLQLPGEQRVVAAGGGAAGPHAHRHGPADHLATLARARCRLPRRPPALSASLSTRVASRAAFRTLPLRASVTFRPLPSTT